MDRIPRRVDMRVGSDWFAIHTDFQQIGGGDLLEHQFMLLDQEVIWLPRHAHGEMIEDQVRPLAMFGVRCAAASSTRACHSAAETLSCAEVWPRNRVRLPVMLMRFLPAGC